MVFRFAEKKNFLKNRMQDFYLTALSMDVERDKARTLITLVIWSNCSFSSQVSQGNHQP